jgi:twitching motility protein PilT
VFAPEQQEQVRVQIAGTLQGVVTQALLPTADGQGRVPALEILLPDDAVRNLIRQGKVEQIYSVMQTGTAKGMQTMEQSLAELILRGVVDKDIAVSRSSRPEQLVGLLERAGFGDDEQESAEQNGNANEPAAAPAAAEPVFGGLRVAGN